MTEADKSLLTNNVLRVREKIAAACRDANRTADGVTVLAATKTVSADKINLLKDNGILLAGENRVQEFLSKADGVSGMTWDFIGSLQTNKVKQIVGKVRCIHSLDRESLADEIQYRAEKANLVQDCLLEINGGGEESKSGVALSRLEKLYLYAKECKNIRVTGFMPVLPVGAKENVYKEMQEVFNRYAARDRQITILSMGMSGDYETAIRCGATLVRLGSCLFGARQY